MSVSYSGSASSVNDLGKDEPECSIQIFNGYSDFRYPISFSNRGEPKGGKRKSISKFSPRSRNNLLKKIFALSRYPSLFITLTYPKLYPADSKEWKRHLDNFYRSFKDKFPKSWFVWKLEPQKRGAPHFHLIGDLGAACNIVMLRQYIAALWYRTCDTGDIKHLKAGTQADYINDSINKIRSYVCKYVGKAETDCTYQEWQHPGRFWGIIGRKNLPPFFSTIIEVSTKEYNQIKRFVRKWLKRLSDKTRKYSARLKRIPSFFLLAHSEIIKKFIQFVTGINLSEPDSYPFAQKFANCNYYFIDRIMPVF